MPELPEVETVRRGLLAVVQGKTIKEVKARWPRIIESPETELFCQQLIGETIDHIERRGKFLIFKLSHYDMISHLRMEGKYEYTTTSNELYDKHTHVIFKFNDDTQLLYQDTRKFGRMTLVAKDTSTAYSGLMRLGPEPTPEAFQLSTFMKELKRYETAIKPLLLNQRLVTGLGNIYVDEALFQASIHPLQPACTLKKAEVILLHQAIIEVLARAVAAGGSTIRTYVSLGEAGKFQLSLNVYGQTGQPCVTCGQPIAKMKVAQRGTHFCPNCQRYRQRKIQVIRK